MNKFGNTESCYIYNSIGKNTSIQINEEVDPSQPKV